MRNLMMSELAVVYGGELMADLGAGMGGYLG